MRRKAEELLIEAHSEMDQTLTRMKAFRATLEAMAFDMDGDIAALIEIQKEIEELWSDQDHKQAADGMELSKAQAEQKMEETA